MSTFQPLFPSFFYKITPPLIYTPVTLLSQYLNKFNLNAPLTTYLVRQIADQFDDGLLEICSRSHRSLGNCSDALGSLGPHVAHQLILATMKENKNQHVKTKTQWNMQLFDSMNGLISIDFSPSAKLSSDFEAKYKLPPRDTRTGLNKRFSPGKYAQRELHRIFFSSNGDFANKSEFTPK